MNQYLPAVHDVGGEVAGAGKVVEATNHTIEVRPFRATGRLRAHG